MSSTSTSDLLMTAKNLKLVFKTQVFRPWTLREQFIQIAKNPLDLLFDRRDRWSVLDGVNLEIRRGDRVGLVGVNGTGKTTLCRTLAGFYMPSSGALKVHGQVRAVFDTAIGIYPDLTGRENAYLLASLMFPTLEKEHKALVEEALEFSELGAFLDAPYKTYSNGMQARLCLSMVSSRPADVLILDEVFDGADQFFREKISQRIVKLIEKSGAVLFVSHSSDQIRRVCNRVIVFQKGKVAFDGGVEEGLSFYEKSSNPNQ